MSLQTELSQTKRPKIFSMPPAFLQSPLVGLELQDADRKIYPVFDLSLSGIIAPNFLPKFRAPKQLELSLKIAEQRPIKLSVSVAELKEHFVFLAFDSLSLDRRLHIDQPSKEQIIAMNLRNIDLQSKQITWVHGPFESDFILNEEDRPASMMIEFDGLQMSSSPEGWLYCKSNSFTEAGMDYLACWKDPRRLKTSRGASWLERVLKFRSICESLNPHLRLLFERLNFERGQ